MEVYLIRHTETISSKGCCYGHSDIALKTPYLDCFDKIISGLTIQNPIIYSSPLIRCKQLAEHFKNHYRTSTEIQFDSRLKEMNFGDWEMQEWNTIEPTSLNVWMNDFVNQQTPNGESFVDLYERINEFIDKELLTKNYQDPVVIITHAGVIRSFLCSVLELLLNNAFKISVDYGSVSRIQFYGENNTYSKVDYTNKL